MKYLKIYFSQITLHNELLMGDENEGKKTNKWVTQIS